MKISIIVFPFIALALVYVFKGALISLGSHFPQCPSVTFLDVYCPGCGNTRSVQHLLQGDIAGSVRFNPSPLFGALIAALAYAELVTAVFGRHIKLVPRSRKFWVGIIVVFSLYFIIRNFIRPF